MYVCSSFLCLTLDFRIFDEHTEGESDGGAGGFGSCQVQIQHSGHQVVVVELSGGNVFLLKTKSQTALIPPKNEEGVGQRREGFQLTPDRVWSGNSQCNL